VRGGGVARPPSERNFYLPKVFNIKMRKQSIQKHFQVFLKSAAWSKDWKPKSREALPSSSFSSHYFEKYPQSKKHFPYVA